MLENDKNEALALEVRLGNRIADEELKLDAFYAEAGKLALSEHGSEPKYAALAEAVRSAQSRIEGYRSELEALSSQPKGEIAQPKAEAEPKVEPEVKVEAGPEPAPQPIPQPQPVPAPQPVAEPQPVPAAEPVQPAAKPEGKICPYCHASIPSFSVFCTECGKRV